MTAAVLEDAATESTPTRPQDRVFGVVATVVGVWAVFLNFFKLPVAQVIWDEPIYALAGWRYVHLDVFAPGQGGDLGDFADNFEHPPLAKYLFGIAQVFAGGQSITAARVVASLCTLATAALLGWWLSRRYDRWTGLALAGVVATAPMVVAPSLVRFGRFAMLDAVAGLLVVACLVVGWQWMQTRGRRALGWAVATGIVVGLATSAKESSFLVLVGPVLLVLWLDRRRILSRIVEAAVIAVLAVVTFVATYLPLGYPVDRIRYLWDFQTKHSRLGHTIAVDGTTYAHQPWWSNLWFTWNALGTMLTVLLVLGVLAAVVLRRDRLVAFVLAGLAAPMVFFFFVARVTLPFYWVMWAPLAMTVAVVGWRSSLRVLARSSRRPHLVAVGGAALAVLVAIPALGATATTAALEPVDVARIPLVMQSEGLHGPVLVSGVSQFDARTYLSPYLVTQDPKAPGAADTVVIGSPKCGKATDRVAAALIALNTKWNRIRKVYEDDQVVVYRSLGRLLPPGYLDVITIKPPTC